MTFETLYLTLERSYQSALVALYNADIPGDERSAAIQDLRGRLDSVMDASPIREFIAYCDSIVSKYQH